MNRPLPIRALLAALLLVLAGVLGAQPALADPPGRVGRLADLEGTVWFYSPDQGEWVEAVRNRPVTNGDHLATDAGGRATLRIGSTTVRLDGSTELAVQRLDDDAIRLQLVDGSLALRVRTPEAAREAEVSTDEGRFLPREPGSYRIDRADDTSTATAWRGSLRYESDGQAITLDDGQRADFWLDHSTARFNLVGPDRDDFADWVAARDRDDDRTPVPSYVSPEMTGAEDLGRYGTWQSSPDYGVLWVPTVVVAGWAPYHYGHWGFVQPWGWTWIDDAPWGFAPFHYGRWVQFGGRWCWSPGAYVARPVYAPALVAWLGGPNFSISVSVGAQPAVGWFPLGPREVYVPSYAATPRYVRQVNVTQVTNITQINTVINNPGAAGQRHFVNRNVAGAVTIVPTSALTQRRPVAPVALKAPDPRTARELSREPVVVQRPPVTMPPATRAAVGGAAPPAPPARIRGPRERAAPGATEPPATERRGTPGRAGETPARRDTAPALPKIPVPPPASRTAPRVDEAPGTPAQRTTPAERRAAPRTNGPEARAVPPPPRARETRPEAPRAEPPSARETRPGATGAEPPRVRETRPEGARVEPPAPPRERPAPRPREEQPRNARTAAPTTVPAPRPVPPPTAAAPSPPVAPAAPRVAPRAHPERAQPVPQADRDRDAPGQERRGPVNRQPQ